MNEAGLIDFEVVCPYCGEIVEVAFESDVAGELVQDCEVCCQPWQVQVVRGSGGVRVEVRRLDD